MSVRGLCLVSLALLLAFGCGASQPPLERTKEGLRFEPEALSFGDVFVESNLLRRVRVRNSGDVSLSLRAASAPPSFDVSPLQIRLEPGEAQEVEIRFRPLRAGRVDGAIAFRSATGGEWRLPVEGDATPIVLDLPASVDFGAVPAGVSLVRDVSIRSLSDAPLDLTIQGLGAPAFRFDRIQRALPARGTLRLPVEFTPLEEGETEGWLRVQACPDCAGQLIRLRGVGLAHRLRPIPEFVDFGQVPPGTTGSARLEVENRGNLRARLEALVLEPKEAADVFALQGPPLPTIVEAGESLTWSLTFSPTEDGDARARLHFLDAGGASLLEIPVQGRAAGPYLHAEPLQLGLHQVETPGARRLRIERLGAAGSITIETFRFEGPNAGDFQIQGARFPLVIEEDTEVEVHFETREPGAVQASLHLVTSYVGQPELVVPISGFAVDSACEIETNEALRFGLVDGARSHQRRLELRQAGAGSCLIHQVGLEQQVPDFRLLGAPSGAHLLGPGESLHFYVELVPAPSWEGWAEGRLTWTDAPHAAPREIPLSAYRADPLPIETDDAIDLTETPVGRLSFAILELQSNFSLSDPVIVRLAAGSSPGIQFEEWTGTVGWSTQQEIRFAPEEAGPHRGAIEVLVPGYPEAIRVALRGQAPETCAPPCMWPELRCSGPERLDVGEEGLLTSGLEELPTDHTSCVWAPKVRGMPAWFTPTPVCNARFTPFEAAVYDLILRLRTGSIGAECELRVEAVDPPEDDP